ncbi:MAG: TSUP family transporter [Pseudomonadales bacterium]|nr:TSUP family transporter [Pseudomonadales bacterium]
MNDLQLYQYLLIALVFVWSAFVRSGLGFGGAVLSLPILLLIIDNAQIFLPIISIHLLVFASLTVWNSHKLNRSAEKTQTRSTVDWVYLKKALKIMIIPKLIGVFGLLTLPHQVMSALIFSIVMVYAISYIINKPFTSNKPWMDVLFLMLGAYISGTSLIGAPLIIAVFACKVAKDQLRDTLFVLWFILVTIKLSAFIYAGVDLQLIHQLWLLPCAAVGHMIGLKFHQRMLKAETATFFRFVGVALLLISILGLYNAFF